ncbi:isopenicillin N synthase family oxygenase [Cyanobacteria bacterium FACHB-63]|nr:isopenicillin N synthase family oxygenase [Cyanobacteria bacterium FACHB-63]
MALQLSESRSLQIPIVNIDPLVSGVGDKENLINEIRQSCCDYGFFYVVGHGIDETLQQQLEQLSRQFFAQAVATKLNIRMELGGRAWRGYFPVGNELTSGKPDLKEGIYFGAELHNDHPLVQAKTPLHGANLFPALPQFREIVLEYMAAMAQLGHTLMSGIALSLGLDEGYFRQYTSDPLTLFRIFNYPPHPINCSENWGVGEHTDYGVLTILKQDESGGLQVKSQSRWIDAPSISGSFVCNIGDMLDRMTGGYYRSTPHRVRNLSKRDRLSFPFFFDPNFDAEVKPIEMNRVIQDDQAERWDRSSVHAFQGTYGEYVLSKVSKVFPELCSAVL